MYSARSHSRPAEGFHRYRIVDSQSIELLPAPGAFPHQRSFQNRELLNLFAQFRSSKTFVGRDQIRDQTDGVSGEGTGMVSAGGVGRSGLRQTGLWKAGRASIARSSA